MGARIELRDVTISYAARGGSDFDALRSISATIAPGSVTAVLGISGSGKSSLLNAISGIIKPRAGSIIVDGTSVDALSREEACDLRRGRIGFVFQAFHLLPHFTALENAALGGLVSGLSAEASSTAATDALREVGLRHRAAHRPAELSGGEQQRVALARAIVAQPALVLADEPTGNLDPAATDLVVTMLLKVRELTGATIIVATHSPIVAERGDAALALPDPYPNVETATDSEMQAIRGAGGYNSARRL